MRRSLYLIAGLILSLALVMAGCGSKDDKKMTLDEVTPATTTQHPALAPDTDADPPPEREAAETPAATAAPAAPTAAPETTSEDKDKDKAPQGDSAVFMSFEITGEGEMDLVVQNNGEEDISTGRGFILEKQAGDAWETIELGLAFTQDMVVIGPDEEHAFTYRLPDDFSFESGTTYRVVKYVSLANGDELTLAASFDVE